MFFSPEISHAPTLEYNQAIYEIVREASYTGRVNPNYDDFQSFTFDQTVIAIEGGRQSLKLLKPLKLYLNPEALSFTVVDWGIEMDSAALPNLPREIARRFLQLLNQAENENLLENDQAAWLRILDYIDFQQFSIERSAPRYMEGVLHRNSEFTIVEWHDGNQERLTRKVVSALNEVNVGEKFSAFVKMGKNNESIVIERVSLLQNVDAANNWDLWPTKK